MQTTIIIDIETAPLPVEQIHHLKPEFTAPANWKDPEKIRANVAEQEAKWLADGALSALTGRILCVGMLSETFKCEPFDDEPASLETWWRACQDWLFTGGTIVGFCSRSFDFPFLIRRSWALKVKVPPAIFEGRYLSSQIVDVAERWGCGGREPRDRISLDNLSKFLGTGQKNGDGANFAKLWATDRAKATAYVQNDCMLTKLAFERLF